MKTLNVVFKTHLDIGFTDLAEVVVDTYMNEFIPKAIAIANESEQFVWTVGSWLIDYYLNSDKVSDQGKEELICAIKSGNIVWHGLPFTTHTELMDKKLFEYGLSIAQKLDHQFDKKTISAKMTDVPGHTLAIVPLMAKAGLKYLHIGVNASSAIPNIPEIFLWRASDGSEIVVHYDAFYGGAYVNPNWQEGIYFAHSNDNCGPPADAREVETIIADIKAKYPDYEIKISSINDFAAYAWDKRQSLPVVTEEIGDSWIHGVASDPEKIAHFKKLLLLRDAWLKDGTMTIKSDEYKNFSNQLLLIPEHTWGANGNLFLPDYKNYLLKDFHRAREADQVDFSKVNDSLEYSSLMQSINMYVKNQEAFEKSSYKAYEKSWGEQRNYLDAAINSLSKAHQQEALEILQSEEAVQLQTSESKIMFNRTYEFGRFCFAFDSDGSMKKLELNGRSLIKENRRIGRLSYEAFDGLDFQKYLYQYSRINESTGSWVFVDFAKRGIEAIPEIKHKQLHPFVYDSQLTEQGEAIVAQFHLMYEEQDQEQFGIPKDIWLIYELDKETSKLRVSLSTGNKQVNRMPEAYWLECSLAVNNPYLWKMKKLGWKLSPYKVVKCGNRQMHALDFDALNYDGSDGNYQISVDQTPVFSFGGKNLLKFKDEINSLQEGIYINLYNNVWGTNFPAWYDGKLQTNVEFDFSVNDLLGKQS